MKIKIIFLLGLLMACLNQGAVLAENRNDITLNPLPTSILLDPDLFSVTEITHVTARDMEGGYGTVWYHGAGDLDMDGNPEILMSGWTANGQTDANGHPPASELYIFEANDDQTSLIGTYMTAGTAFIRVEDFNADKRPDVLIAGHNESPFVNTENVLYLNGTSGFVANRFEPYMAMHEGNTGDFNGDGYTDFIGSAYMSDIDTQDDPQAVGLTSSIILFLNDKNGGFDAYPLRFNMPVEGYTWASGHFDSLTWINGGSATAFGNLDGDPAMEVVVVDMIDSMEGSSFGTNTILIDDIRFESKHAWGTPRPLPKPYFDVTPHFFDNPSMFGDKKPHDVQVEIFDIDNDDDNDIVISSMIWVADGHDAAGVVQFLRNDGRGRFSDVTNSTLYNFNLGTEGGGHDNRFVDVNGDGFIDILKVEGGYGESTPHQWQGWSGQIWRTLDRTWGNDILINAGNGKFVSTFWGGLHQMTLRQEPLLQSYGTDAEPYDLVEAPAYPYLLQDGTLGYVMFNNGGGKHFFFDLRAKHPLSTGPGGQETATLGAVGYSEYFYLTEYPDVAAAVSAGHYKTGLEHFLSVGRSEGRYSFAPGAMVHGSEEDDRIDLREGDEKAFGYAGNDVFRSYAGSDQLDGGTGTDTSVYDGPYATYTVVRESERVTEVTGPDSDRDRLTNIERLQFSDTHVALDMEGNAGRVAMMLGAVFGPDSVSNREYVGIGLKLLDDGMSYSELGELALKSKGAMSADEVVTLLRTNVVGTLPSVQEKAPYIDMLQQGMTIGELAVRAAETELNRSNIGYSELSVRGLRFTVNQ